MNKQATLTGDGQTWAVHYYPVNEGPLGYNVRFNLLEDALNFILRKGMDVVIRSDTTGLMADEFKALSSS
jgi:hypothetical protein